MITGAIFLQGECQILLRTVTDEDQNLAWYVCMYVWKFISGAP